MSMLIPASLLLILSIAGDPSASTDWEEAIRSNQTDAIRALYRHQADIDEANEHGKTALMAAAAAGDTALVADLLAAGADPAATNRLDGSVLMYAAGSGSVETLQRLLDTGIALNGQASNGWSAIMMATAKNDATLLTLLSAAGADPNTQDIYGWTPLMRAVFDRHDAAVSALLALPGVELDRTNKAGQTALHLAVIGGSADLVKALVEKGADQVRDFNDYTPQSIARELRRRDLLTLLNTAVSEPTQ